MTLRAPFPWFGGKSRAAALVWQAFGDVANYVEPFAGSLAVMLGRPTSPRVETVNDKDCYLANFWRAVHADPEGVAHHADWPVNEADLHARHRWLVEQASFRERMRREPDFYDVKIAGWWVWGISQWIGSGWCTIAASSTWRQMPDCSGSRGATGRGIHSVREQMPMLRGDTRATGAGVHASGKKGTIIEWLQALSARLRYVRVCCGDWKRVLTPSVTEAIGTTAVFLDPPYSSAAGRDPSIYAEEDLDVAHAVREWALANGDNPKLLIALCGYEGEHELPANWRCVAWKAPGGYAASAGNTANAQRERIWFSPHCLGERQPTLFDFAEAAR